MPINLSELKTELETDPMSIGLTSLYNEGRDAACADALNEVREGVNYEANRGVIPSHEVVKNIVATDWTALDAAGKERISFIVSAGEVDSSAANVVNAFVSAFNGTTTLTNLTEMVNKQVSRAMKLFNTSVSTNDVSATRKL